MENSKNGLNTFNKVLCLFIVVIAFSFAFVVLVKKQQGNNLGDMAFNSSFSGKTIYNKEILARDMEAIYPRYFSVYTLNNSYNIQCVNYYETESQFDLEFSRLIDSIIDYNRKEKMIRYTVSEGYLPYDEVKDNLARIVGVNNLKIYE